VKVAGKWAYLYRAVDSAGETIEFMSEARPDRGEVVPAPRIIRRRTLAAGNQCGRPSGVCSAIAELKQSGDLGRRCRCRTSPYLNNIIEQDQP
jgi:transposase-like protein